MEASPTLVALWNEFSISFVMAYIVAGLGKIFSSLVDLLFDVFEVLVLLLLVVLVDVVGVGTRVGIAITSFSGTFSVKGARNGSFE